MGFLIAHLVHKGVTEEVARAGDLQHRPAVAVISSLIGNGRHPVRPDGCLAQVRAAQAAAARQQHTSNSCRVEGNQLCSGRVFGVAPAGQPGAAAAWVVVEDVNARGEHNRHTVHMGAWICVRVPILAGDDCRFNDGAVDRLEGAEWRISALQPLQLNSFQLAGNDLLIGRAIFVAVVAATNEPIRAGVGVDIEGERGRQRICLLNCPGDHSGVTAQLTHCINKRSNLFSKLIV